MKLITRKTMLYKTGVEYGDYTMNHVLGCSHGCKYPCYAYMMAKRFGKVGSYEDWLEPRLVSNTLELLDKEIPKLKDRIKSVQLCFTTDPFMFGYKEIETMSLSAIRKLNNAGIKCMVLTKGLLPLELAGYSPDNEYGITFVSLDEHYREKISIPELAAAAYLSERECYRVFHDCLHVTPVEYITTYRLQVACQMLAKGQESVTVISHECGLGSSSYFGKVFREYAHCSPIEYRKKWQNSDR